MNNENVGVIGEDEPKLASRPNSATAETQFLGAETTKSNMDIKRQNSNNSFDTPTVDSIFEDAKSDKDDDYNWDVDQKMRVAEMGDELLDEKMSELTEILAASPSVNIRGELDNTVTSFSDTGVESLDVAPCISPIEIDASRRIRKKYGLIALDGRSRTPSDSTLDNLTLAPVPAMATDASKEGREPEREIAMILALGQQLVKALLEDEICGSAIESEHSLLPSLLALLELVINHGWRGAVVERGFFSGSKVTIWDLIRRLGKHGSHTAGNGTAASNNSASASILENVKNFTSLKGSSAKVRAWIRLALMSKCFSTDLTTLLNNEGHLIADCYEEWSLTRSDAFLPLLAIISTLDTLDFNLFIKEEDIVKREFSFDWKNAFKENSIDLKLFDPPTIIESFSRPSSAAITAVAVTCADPLAADEGSLGQGLLRRLQQLKEENIKLRKSLISQINQRAYFQNEYTKSQSKCANLLEETFALGDERALLKRSLKELNQLVEAHEHTNQSLQRQLSEVHEQASVNEAGQVTKLQGALNRLEVELRVARATQKDLVSKLEIALRERSLAESRANLQIDITQEGVKKIEQSWADRVAVLQEQLKLANSLKEEYKRKLKQLQPYQSSLDHA